MLYKRRNEKQWEISKDAAQEEVLDREKCTKQFVLNVAKNAKFHSSLQKENLFSAGNAIEKRKDSNSLDIVQFSFFIFLFFFNIKRFKYKKPK